MNKEHSQPPGRRLGTGLIATVSAFCLLLVITTAAFANTVNVYDRAGVLNKSQVQNEASSLPFPIDIYTVNNFSGGSTNFDRQAQSSINRNGMVVMAIDTTNRHLTIVGRGVSLSNSQYADARNAFASNFRNNDYTSATIAAIQSLRNASGGGGLSVPGFSSSGGGLGFGTICCVGLLILAALAVFGVLRSRKRGGSGGGGFFNRGFGFNRRPVQPPYDPNYNQPYNQGGYPPNYGPGYPGYNQNQPGMNPWAAGGLGAAAGGLVGYELGKNQGEREGQNQGGFGGDGGGASGDFGGGGGGFGGDGGGSGGDGGGFGGGGGDFGGGGGDSGGSSGGGGDSGGSSGGF